MMKRMGIFGLGAVVLFATLAFGAGWRTYENTIWLGDPASAGDRNIYFEVGNAPTNPALRWDDSETSFTIANDGATFLRIPQASGALTASEALVTNGSGVLTTQAGVSATEVGYLSTVTSDIQTQLNGTVKTTGNQSVAGIKNFTDELGTGEASPIARVEMRATSTGGPATSGGTASAGTAIRISASNDNGFEMGAFDSGLGGWVQANNRANHATFNPFLLNPAGGNVAVGDGTPPTSTSTNVLLTVGHANNAPVIQNVIDAQASFAHNAYFTGTVWNRRDTGQAAMAVRMNNSGGIGFHVAASGANPITNWDTTDVKMKIQTDGDTVLSVQTDGVNATGLCLNGANVCSGATASLTATTLVNTVAVFVDSFIYTRVGLFVTGVFNIRASHNGGGGQVTFNIPAPGNSVNFGNNEGKGVCTWGTIGGFTHQVGMILAAVSSQNIAVEFATEPPWASGSVIGMACHLTYKIRT